MLGPKGVAQKESIWVSMRPAGKDVRSARIADYVSDARQSQAGWIGGQMDRLFLRASLAAHEAEDQIDERPNKKH